MLLNLVSLCFGLGYHKGSLVVLPQFLKTFDSLHFDYPCLFSGTFVDICSFLTTVWLNIFLSDREIRSWCFSLPVQFGVWYIAQLCYPDSEL